MPDHFKCCKTSNFCLLQGSFGPFGPKVAKKESEMISWASRPQGPKKSRMELKKSQNSWKIVDFDAFSSPFWNFIFEARGWEALGTHFGLFFATLGPKGRNGPYSLARESQFKCIIIIVILVVQHCDPSYRAIWYRYNYRIYVFQCIAGYRAVPPPPALFGGIAK